MPSTKVPASIVSTTGMLPAVLGVGGGGAGSILAHITDTVDAHNASAISYDGGPNWADGTPNDEVEVEAQIDAMITDLSDTTTGAGGAGKVGVVVSTVGTVSLAAGELAVRLRDLQSAASINYAGGGNWQDGTSNPATNVEAQLDKFITDLATAADGGDKISFDPTGGQWEDGGELSSTQLSSAIREMIVALASKAGGDDGAHLLGVESVTVGTVTNSATDLLGRLTALQNATNLSTNGALTPYLGGRTNPDTNVRAALDRIIVSMGTSTVGDDGAERVGSEARTGNIKGSLSSGSVASQLQQIINDNIHGRGLGTDAATARLEIRRHVAGVGRDKALMVDMPYQEGLGAENFGFRIYHQRASGTGSNDFLWIVANASYNNGTTLWTKDNTGARSSALVLDGGNLYWRYRDSGAGTWADAAWEEHLQIDGANEVMDITDYQIRWSGTLTTSSVGANPSGTTGITNRLTAKNLVKAWGRFTNSMGGVTTGATTSFNTTSASRTTTSITVNFADDFDSTPCVVVTFDGGSNFIVITSAGTGSFTFQIYSHAGVLVDPTAGSFDFTYIAMGYMT